MDEQSKAKTAFITEDQRGEFQRLVFGLKNAPAQFSQLMAIVLSPLKQQGVLVFYLDDVLIGANTWSEMLEKLEKVLEAFRKAKLSLKLEKCEFGKQEVEFLGFLVNKNGIKPGVRKVDAIRHYQTPKIVHDVRRFLGLTSFFRRFIPKYAILAKPLSDLTRQREIFRWESEQVKAFENLKNLLTSNPILKLYNPDDYTELHTDASSLGIAGMLMQKNCIEIVMSLRVTRKKKVKKKILRMTRLRRMKVRKK